MMAYEYVEAEIVDIKDETEMVRRFFIKMPDDYAFSFKAGQFIMINLPIDHKYKNRSYSIASAPNDSNWFELCIVLNPGGTGTPFIWENYCVGDKLMVSKALGKFALPEAIDRDICFICTGTGIAPLRSMALDIFNKRIPHKKVYMIFGTRYEKDILYRDEMESLSNSNPEFSFIPVLSREEWSGRSGYVHQVYKELFTGSQPAYFYLCGWKEMLNETRRNLEAMGYGRTFIRFESYD